MFHEKFRFKKVFNSCCEFSQLPEQLEGMIVTIKLMQVLSAVALKEDKDDIMLAYFQSSACNFLFPSADLCPNTMERRLVLHRTICFPASKGRNPALDFSSITILHESTLPAGKLWKCDGNCALDICKPLSWCPCETSFVRYSRPVSPLRNAKECKECGFVTDDCDADFKSGRSKKLTKGQRRKGGKSKPQLGLQNLCTSLRNCCNVVEKCKSPQPLTKRRRRLSPAPKKFQLNTKYADCGCGFSKDKRRRTFSPTVTRNLSRKKDGFVSDVDCAENRTRRMRNLLDDIKECGCFVNERPPFVVRKVDSKQFKRMPGLIGTGDGNTLETSFSPLPLESKLYKCLNQFESHNSKFNEIKDPCRRLERRITNNQENSAATNCPICQCYLRYLGKPYQGHCHGRENTSKMQGRSTRAEFDDDCQPLRNCSDPYLSSNQGQSRDKYDYRKAKRGLSDDFGLSELNKAFSNQPFVSPFRSSYKTFDRTFDPADLCQSITDTDTRFLPDPSPNRENSIRKPQHPRIQQQDKSLMSAIRSSNFSAADVESIDFIRKHMDDWDAARGHTKNSVHDSKRETAPASQNINQEHSSSVRQSKNARNVPGPTLMYATGETAPGNASYVTPSQVSRDTNLGNVSFVTPSYATRNSTAQNLSALDPSFHSRNEVSKMSHDDGNSRGNGQQQTQPKELYSTAGKTLPSFISPCTQLSPQSSIFKQPSQSSSSYVTPDRTNLTASSVNRTYPHLVTRTSLPHDPKNVPLIADSSLTVPNLPHTYLPAPFNDGNNSYKSPHLASNLDPSVPLQGRSRATNGSYVVERHSFPSGKTFTPSVVRHDQVLCDPSANHGSFVPGTVSVPPNGLLTSPHNSSRKPFVSSARSGGKGGSFVAPYPSQLTPFVPDRNSITKDRSSVHTQQRYCTDNVTSSSYNPCSPCSATVRSSGRIRRSFPDSSTLAAAALPCGVGFSDDFVPLFRERDSCEKSSREPQSHFRDPTKSACTSSYLSELPQGPCVPSSPSFTNEPNILEHRQHLHEYHKHISLPSYAVETSQVSGVNGINESAKLSRIEKPRKEFIESSKLVQTGNAVDGKNPANGQNSLFKFVNDTTIVPSPAIPATSTPRNSFQMSSTSRLFPAESVMSPLRDDGQQQLIQELSKIQPHPEENSRTMQQPVGPGTSVVVSNQEPQSDPGKMHYSVDNEAKRSHGKMEPNSHQANLSKGPIELSTGPIGSESFGGETRTAGKDWKYLTNSTAVGTRNYSADSQQMLRNHRELTTGRLSDDVMLFDISDKNCKRGLCSSALRSHPMCSLNSTRCGKARRNFCPLESFDSLDDDSAVCSETRGCNSKCRDAFASQFERRSSENRRVKNRSRLSESSRPRRFKELPLDLSSSSSSSREIINLSPGKTVLKLSLTSNVSEDEDTPLGFLEASDLSIIDVWGPLRTSDVDVVSIHPEPLADEESDVEDLRNLPRRSSKK